MKRTVLFAIAVLVLSTAASGEVVVLGGPGSSWEEGGGGIQAQVIRGESVEPTNTPGGVIDFSVEGYDNWIFPQRADPELNIAVGTLGRGGEITTPTHRAIRNDLGKIIDDRGNTGLDLRETPVLGLIVDLDLGARFGVNRFRFFPRNALPEMPAADFPFQNDFLRGYELFLNDGTPESTSQGRPIRTSVAVEGQNEEPVVEIRIPAQYVRLIRLKSLTAVGFDLAEFQVFGTGFVPEAAYISNIIDFGAPTLLGNLRWVQEKVGDEVFSRVRVRTRSGIDPQPLIFNKIRPAEDIFRISGQFSPRESHVPWKFADKVDDPELKALVENVLDNIDVDIRDATQTFNELSLEQREELSLTEADHGSLARKDRGVIRHDVTGWSEWSAVYPAEAVVAADELQVEGLGVPIVSPSPRRYFQVLIEFYSDEFESATGVGGLAFDVLTRPFSGALVGEIRPRRAELGEKTRFTYAVRSLFEPGRDRGFDRLKIQTPLRVEEVGSVEIRRADGTVEAADFTGSPLSDSDLPVARGDFSILEVEEKTFTVGFPVVAEDGAELRVTFDNAVLRFGTTFSGQALSSETGAVLGQHLLPGNAADLGEGDGDTLPLGSQVAGNLAVHVGITDDLLVNVNASPAVITPNGDGANDQTSIGYDLTTIGAPTPVEVVLRDLSGRPVRRLYAGNDVSGRFALPWDGRDDAGRIVPPGNYVFSVTVDARTGLARAFGTVAVTY